MLEKDIAIRVKGLAKIYRIGVLEERADSLGGLISNFLKSPVKNFKKYSSLYNFNETELASSYDGESDLEDILWANRDISFEIPRGQVVGIIGHNGAGKSTLLKLLTQITPPSAGRIEIHGRVSSLLEVGTGFHPELTGRENVYLNGTILGMRKREVDEKFDEIVEFSGIGKFLDTPVKRYSSGMKVRLAFAVAAHLEPEILLIDEVLAVGDADFQRKCLNKMQDVGQQGRTVIFVSHNMAAVTRMCERVIQIDGGKVLRDGRPDDVVSRYLAGGESGAAAERYWTKTEEAPGDDVARLLSVRVVDRSGDCKLGYSVTEDIGLEIEYKVLKDSHPLIPYFILTNSDGITIFSSVDQDPSWTSQNRPIGSYKTTAWILKNLLSEGMVYLSVVIRTTERKYRPVLIRDAIAFNISDPMDGTSARGNWAGMMHGIVRPKLEWVTTSSISDTQ